jgi:hypothetical protein
VKENDEAICMSCGSESDVAMTVTCSGCTIDTLSIYRCGLMVDDNTGVTIPREILPIDDAGFRILLCACCSWTTEDLMEEAPRLNLQALQAVLKRLCSTVEGDTPTLVAKAYAQEVKSRTLGATTSSRTLGPN